jgi:hypothetical protein
VKGKNLHLLRLEGKVALFAFANLLIGQQVGLDSAGKTTILYRLKLGEVVATIPTLGTSVFVCGSARNFEGIIFRCAMLQQPIGIPLS